MRRIIAIEKGSAREARDSICLDFDQRNRRRMVFTTDGGHEILLDMPRAVHMRDGDLLRLDDGSTVKVKAVGEPLIAITAPSTAALVRIAWHLGNRHLPTQLVDGPNGGSLRIRHDHVIAEMAVGLGGQCAPLLAPFDPEGGAYAAGGHTHGHHHSHDDGHDHHHHSHTHEHAYG